MNKNYFNYLLKTKKSLMLAVIVFYVLGAVISFTIQSSVLNNAYVNLIITSVILALASFAMVPITYGYVHNKKAVDTYFSLPITRKEMLITSQLYIDLLVLVPFLVSCTASLIIGRVYDKNLVAFLLYLLVAIIAVIVFVAFETAIFLEANTTFDGVVMMSAYLIIPIFIVLLLETFVGDYITGVEPINVEQIISYISLPVATAGNEIYLGECFSDLSTNCKIINKEFFIFVVSALWHSIVAFYALRNNYINRKVERAETISNSFFSYPFIMYAYAFLIVMSISLSIVSSSRGKVIIGSEWIIILAVILVLFLISNFVYRRKVKIYFKDILFFVITVVISLGFSYAAYNTKGFGLSNHYDHDPKNIAFEYECWYEPDEIKEILPEFNTEGEEVGSGIMVQCFIKEEEMNSKKDVVNFIDRKRQESIDTFYEYTDWAYLVIRTNYDPKDYGDANILYEDSKDTARYERSKKIDLKELIKYKDDFKIYIETYGEELGIEYQDINNLLNNTQSK